MTITTDNLKDGANYGIGAASGFAVYKYTPRLMRKPVRKLIGNDVKKITQREHEIFWSAAMKAYHDSFLSKPVNSVVKPSKLMTSPEIQPERVTEIIHVDEFNASSVTQNIQKRMRRFRDTSWLARKLNEKLNKRLVSHISITAKGQNAFCIPNLSKSSSLVVLNKYKMAQATFHELGHAINAKGGGIKKVLSAARGYFAPLAPLTVLAGLLLNRPKEKYQPSKKDNAINFFKDNCGLIAAGCMVPVVIEEGIASINGAKLAKNVLNKDMYKKLNRFNLKAWSTYVIGATMLGISTQLAVYLRDKIVEKRLIK